MGSVPMFVCLYVVHSFIEVHASAARLVFRVYRAVIQYIQFL